MSEQQTIEQVVTNYYNGMYNGDAELMCSAYRPGTVMIGKDGEEVIVETIEEFATIVREAGAMPAENSRLAITAVDVEGELAAVRLHCDYDGVTYSDALNLLKLDGEWKIVAKTWTVI